MQHASHTIAMLKVVVCVINGNDHIIKPATITVFIPVYVVYGQLPNECQRS